jgi:hypothetical protein
VDFVYGSTTTLSGIVVRPGVFLDISTIWKLFVGTAPSDWQLAEQVLHIGKQLALRQLFPCYHLFRTIFILFYLLRVTSQVFQYLLYVCFT